jgi:hypothetical protein
VRNAARVVGKERMTSQAARSRRLGLSGLVLTAAILAVGVAAVTMSCSRDEGPLQPSSVTSVEFPLALEQVATWGADLPPNPTDADIVVSSIEPIDPAGLSILGLAMINPDVSGGIVNAYGFPPDGAATFPVEGSVISPSDGSSPHLEVLIGVRLAEGSDSGSIKGLRLRYVADGREYEVVLPYSLGITLAAP